ncbi:unnamed protein product [Sympodiomycopsis kandeliae]
MEDCSDVIDISEFLAGASNAMNLPDDLHNLFDSKRYDKCSSRFPMLDMSTRRPQGYVDTARSISWSKTRDDRRRHLPSACEKAPP